ncbi:hypothetical protein HU200_017457 [Digitaria exilis]|uniref:U-box domain-containing protein n=1 Tax=Digitaria exilis TaxID=1010633 RepID=A0A835F626_9POAL|nr:hypothetical protein HU200_017457 [Digitaria exilis]
MVTPVSRSRLRPRAAAARVAVAEIPLVSTRRTRPPPPDADEPAVPGHFLCPISLEMMRDPVTAPTGITYDRASVEAWLDRGHATCPVTSRPLRADDLIPNHATRRMIQDWCVAHRALGVERVPTPRVPISSSDADELLAAVVSSAAATRGDAAACRKMAAKARALGKESERNRRCLVAAGAARALSSAFSHLAAVDRTATALTAAMEEILAALVVFFPLYEEARRCIATSPASMDAVVSIMSHGEVAARASAAVVLREIASSSDAQCLAAMSETTGIYAALVKLVEKKPPVSPQATKAAMVTAYYLIQSTDHHAASQLIELGMVELLVELLVDSDKGTTEKALAVLDSLLLTEEGRGKAYGHALAVPVLVKKMQHVSDMATEFAVSALWRLCKNFSGEGPCKAEALQVGAFQKLLLLLQFMAILQ